MALIPQEENLINDLATKSVFYYCDLHLKPVFKAKEIFKKEGKIILYPYYVNKKTDVIRQGKIKTVEFVGWSQLEDLPSTFKKERGSVTYYGIFSPHMKQLFKQLYTKFPKLERVTFGRSIRTRFAEKSIALNWNITENILREVARETAYYNKNKRFVINNELANLSGKYTREVREIHHNELKTFLDKFETFDKITDADTEALSKILDKLPKSKISVTSNFIKTKDKINIAFLEDIINSFEKFMKFDSDIEKKWQDFFEKHSWIFSHLFPYDVILHQREAYVGGKTIENKDGKVVDFLFANGFKDNYALIEIKTHKKDLLRSSAYRGSDVYAMSDDLSGGINQCLDQKETFIRTFGNELRPIDPKCILIIGTKGKLANEQTKCFELLRANQKNVDIITFDELLTKLKGLLNVIKTS
jgi:hypothetical protein